MSAIELWLIRHGETEWSRSGQHTSSTDLPLTPEGEGRARALGQLLKGTEFTLVLTSPMKRAIDTCRLAGLSDRAQITGDLREWDYGAYEGRTTSEIQTVNPGWTIWTAPPLEGETADHVGVRAARVIERVLQSFNETSRHREATGAPPLRAALFAHGHILRVLAARWLGLDAHAGRYLALSTGSVSILAYERQTRVIQLWNRTTE